MLNRDRAQATLLVGQGTPEQGLDVLPAERLKREDLTAAQERRIDGEERVLRGGADEDDSAFFHIGQQHVLLGAIEAVQFIDEQNGPLAGGLQLGTCFLKKLRALP